jgi:hypothetical protein
MSDMNLAVPDLLRRFVSVPHQSSFHSGDIYVRLETNDLSLADALQSAPVVFATKNESTACHWKLIRDDDAPCGEQEVTILSLGEVSTLLSGMGTLITIDRRRHEVLGFIAPDVSAGQFVSLLVPVILDLLIRPLPESAESTPSR